MRITDKQWNRYISVLRELNNKAAEDMIKYMASHDIAKIGDTFVLSEVERKALTDYAFGVATKYGEGASAAAAEMYDAIAVASKAKVPPAVPAPTATYGEVAKTVNGTLKQNPEIVPGAVGRLVKTAGVDTTMQNAIRDGAYWAWVPRGDTCAFCIMLASNGWQKASAKALKNGHAEHIHANCDCTYVVRFGNDLFVEGYDPQQYLDMYQNADGTRWQDKLNSMRRDFYAENKDKINAQKRSAYAKRIERNASAAEETNINAIKFADNVTPQQRRLLERLSTEYKSRVTEVKRGTTHGAGEADAVSGKMGLSSNNARTTIHEFAHMIASERTDKLGITDNEAFWKEIKKIRREYRKDVGNDTDRWISFYEHSSKGVDEFLAEAFTHAKLRELGIIVDGSYGNDYTYSQRVLDVVNKYFKRNK